MIGKNHSMAAYRKALDIAKKRVAETPSDEIDPVAMARKIDGELAGSVPIEYLAEFIASLDQRLPGDRFEVTLTLTENQVHDILGGLAWGAEYVEGRETLDSALAEEMRETRDVVVEQFKGQDGTYIQRRDRANREGET